MAVLKQRLNAKTATGYSVVHLETSSDLVQRDNGTNVEDTLNTLTTNMANLSTSVENVTNNITPDAIGALPATGTAASATKLETARTFQVNLGSTSSVNFDGTSNVTPGVTGTLGVSNGGTGKTTEPLALYNLINGCNTITGDDIVDTDVIPIGDVSAATAKYATIEELKTVLGGGENVASISNIPTTPGNTCNWGGYNWTVVHVTDTLIYMILTNIHSTMAFGSTSQYSVSNLVSACYEFLWTLDPTYQNALSEVYVNGIISKVFVPAHGMVCNNSLSPYSGTSGTLNNTGSGSHGDGTTYYPIFSWFNAAYYTNYSNRIAYYNSTTAWWTSTAYNSAGVWYVSKDGNANNSTGPSGSGGFRPCVAVKR